VEVTTPSALTESRAKPRIIQSSFAKVSHRTEKQTKQQDADYLKHQLTKLKIRHQMWK
jgi:hypothetical protein